MSSPTTPSRRSSAARTSSSSASLPPAEREVTAVPELQITGLNHIHIICSDLAASESWFVDGVGAELVERRESRGMATSELRLAGICLLLRETGDQETIAAGGERGEGPGQFAPHGGAVGEGGGRPPA